MIYNAPPFLVVEGVVVLRDHADVKQFYYYPNNPRLALNPDGSPCFNFVRFRRDLSALPPGVEPGGGVLNFDVDLRIDDDVLQQVKRKIKEQLNMNDDPLLSPIEFKNGRTRLIFLDAVDQTGAGAVTPAATTGTTGAAGATSAAAAGAPVPPAAPPAPGAFVEKASYAATPSLYGDERTAFSVMLSADGATLVEDTLDMKTSMIGVVYDLTFVALRPAYDVELTIDWNRVYDDVDQHFGASVHAFWVTASTDISDEVEKLIEQRVIQLKVTSFAAGAGDQDIVTQKDAAVEFVKKYITEQFFTPSYTPPAKPGQQTSGVAQAINSVKQATAPASPIGVTLSYTYKHMHREDVKHLNLSIHEQDAMEVRIVPQGHLAGLMDVLAQYPRDSYIRDVDLNDDFFKTVKVDVLADAALGADQVDQMKVHFEYGSGTTQPKDVVLSASGATAQALWTYDKAAGVNYTYEYEVLFKDGAPQGAGNSVKSGVINSNATKLVLPDQLYVIQDIGVQAVNIPFDRYTQVEVELGYDDPANKIALTQTYLLSATNQSYTWRIRLADSTLTDYRYRLTYYPVGKPPITGDWKTTSAPALIVTDPYPNVIKVTVLPALDYTKVQRALVTLAYTDAANNISQTDLLPPLASADAVGQWTCNIADGTKRTYTYQVDVQYKDGSVKEYPAVPCSDRMLFVSDSYKLPVKVIVSAAGSFDAAGVGSASVALAYDDPANNNHAAQTLTLTPSSPSGEFDFTIMDPQKTRYSYIVTYSTTDGFNRVDPQATSDQTTLQIALQTPASVS
jgi:hypothetical protein